MIQKRINQEANKIIDAIFNTGTDCEESNIMVLDLKEGFLFYNYAKKWLYKGLSIISPTHLSGEVKRSSDIKNYIVGRNKNDFIMHKDCTLDELESIFKQIIGE